jgi:hypothetical protein
VTAVLRWMHWAWWVSAIANGQVLSLGPEQAGQGCGQTAVQADAWAVVVRSCSRTSRLLIRSRGRLEVFDCRTLPQASDPKPLSTRLAPGHGRA